MSNRRLVERAWLQSPIDVAGLPGATTNISPEKTPNAVMWLTELGLEVQHPTKGNASYINVFIPIANVKVAILAKNTEA